MENVNTLVSSWFFSVINVIVTITNSKLKSESTFNVQINDHV